MKIYDTELLMAFSNNILLKLEPFWCCTMYNVHVFNLSLFPFFVKCFMNFMSVYVIVIVLGFLLKEGQKKRENNNKIAQIIKF